MPFPKGFIWGTATSAGQVEGGALEGGRTPSIWDTFAEKQGKIADGTTPAVACDSYLKISCVSVLIPTACQYRGHVCCRRAPAR